MEENRRVTAADNVILNASANAGWEALRTRILTQVQLGLLCR